MGSGSQFPTVTIALSLERSLLIKENGLPVQKDRGKTDKPFFTQPQYYIVVAEFGIINRAHR